MNEPEADATAAPSAGAPARPRRHTGMSARDRAMLRSLADRIDPRDAGAHNNLGVVFYQKGMVEDAIGAFERALELDPLLVVARLNAEAAYRDSRHLEQRLARLREALETSPDDRVLRDALARTHLLGGDPVAAIREWTRLLEDQPDNPELHLKLARAEMERGRAGAAVRLAERATELDPENPVSRLEHATLLHRAGLDERAERTVREALERDEELARGHALLARLLESRDPEGAERARERAAVLDPTVLRDERHLSLDRYLTAREVRARRAGRPEPADAMPGPLARAQELRRRGELEEAVAALEVALAEEEVALAEEGVALVEEDVALVEGDVALVEGADTFEARQSLAEMRLLLGALDEAVEAYERLLKEQRESPKLWNEQGVAYHRLGRMDEAVECYRRSVALDYGYALGWNNLGVARAQRGETDAAERALRKAAEDESPPEVLWNLGLFLALQDEAGEAVDVYSAALEEDDAIAESWSRLGSALFQANRPAEAREALHRALELDPDLAEARYQLGFALSALGDFKGALRETKRALEQAPVFPPPRYRLLIDVQLEDGSLPAPDADVGERVDGGAEFPVFEFREAELDRAFREFRTPEPDASPDEEETQALLAEARAALRRGRLGRAADRAARAVALTPAAVEPLLLTADIFLRQGLAGEALERYDAVLRSGRQPGAAGEGRARALLQLGRAEAAVAAAEASVERGRSPDVLGRALLEAGRVDRAVAAFERAVAGPEAGPATLTGYGEALLAAGRSADAESVFRWALETTPGAVAARVGLGRSLLAMGDREGAETAYRAAVETLPSYGPAVLGLGELLWEDGRREEAMRSLIAFLELDRADVRGLVLLGRWLLELGRQEHAGLALRKALEADPTNAEARAQLERVRRREEG